MSSEETITLAVPADAAIPATQTVIPRKLGSISLGEEIGRGGMGVVYRGWDVVLRRDVAVKFLPRAASVPDDPAIARFIEGARAVVGARHPGLVALYQADVIAAVPYLVMEYVDGPSLRQLLERTGPLAIDVAAYLLESVCAAVADLHDRGIVHGDLKPANILISREGQIKVTDFGLTAARRPGDREPSRAIVGGTPAYMAPEMFGGTLSPRTDVYALGMMTIELLTGKTPSSGPGLHDAPSLKGVDPAWNEIVERARHPDAIFRYKSASHLADALRRAVANLDARSASTRLQQILLACLGPDGPPLANAAPPNLASRPDYYSHLSDIADARRAAPQGEATTPSLRAPPSAQVSVETRRSLAPDDPRRILRLQRCPKCDYDLRSLPENHRCPECGFAYDPSLFAIYGWSGRERFSLAGRLLLGTWFERTSAMVIVALVVGAVGHSFYQYWATGRPSSGFLFWIPIVVIAGAVRLRPHVRRSRTDQWGTVQLLFSRTGVSLRRGPGEPSYVPWDRFRKVRFRNLRFYRVRKETWRLRLGHPFWQFRWTAFDVLIECSRREAALIRGEVRRRWLRRVRPAKQNHLGLNAGPHPLDRPPGETV